MIKRVEVPICLLLSCKKVGLWCCLVLCGLMCGCSLTRNKSLQQQKQESHSQTSTQEKTNEKTTFKRQEETIDSTSAHFSMLIKPIGTFAYSDLYGFIGNAEYIFLNGQSMKRQQTLRSEKTKTESNTYKKVGQSKKNKAAMRERAIVIKNTLPRWLYLLLGLPLIWLVYLLLSKVWKNRK